MDFSKYLTSPERVRAGVAPSDNFDLLDWKLTLPVDRDENGKADEIGELDLSDGFEDSAYFYTAADGGMVFKAPVGGARTSKNTKYVRTELREMLRQGDTSDSTKGVGGNNWVLSSAPSSAQDDAGGVDGELTATLAVNHVTTTGDRNQVGRVIIGQIHATDDEPLRLYYRKLPDNAKGSIYIAHEPINGSEQWYELIGSRSSSASDPADGIALDETFSYKINAVGDNLTVTIMRPGKPDVVQEVDMADSGFDDDDQYLYFKAGVYNQNNTGEPDDYVQATFYELDNQHTGYSQSEPIEPTPPTPAPTEAIRINVGGDAFSDRHGQTWDADKYFAGGRIYTTAANIDQTANDTLFQSERFHKNLSYNIPVEDGTYTVNLDFAEIYFNGPGRRIFDVSAEDALQLDDFDIYAAAGGKNREVRQSFQVEVTDGILNLDLDASVNNAKLSAIEVLKTAESTLEPQQALASASPSDPHSVTPHQWEYLGFNYPSWWNGKFADSESTQALQQLEATGAQSAAIVATHYLENTQSSEIFATQSTESLQNVEKAITDAKNQGLSVWLKPHIDLQNGEWRGLLAPIDRNTFFRNYKALLMDYAELAQAQGVEVLVIGTEIDQLIGEADKAAWLDIISDVQQVYDGKLTYAANWDAADQISFGEALDFVGVDAYYPLTNNTNASVEQLVQAWTSTPEIDVVRQLTGGQSIVDWLEQVAESYGKPMVFTELGFRSLDGNAAKPYEFQGGGQVDFEEQARLYESVFKVFGGEAPEAGNLDWFQGAQFWNWYATEAQNNDPTDLDYPILGKPSENVFKEYSAQLTSSAPAPGPNPNPNPNPEPTEAIGEYGNLDLNHKWQTIALNGSYDNPVVIVSDPTFNGPDPAAIRLRSVGQNSFQVRLQEPNYKDGSHTSESASYIVMEAGNWTLEDGTRIAVGQHQSNRLTSSGFDAIDLKGFQSTPTILSQVQSENGGDWVTTRTTGQSANRFQLAMQEEEALNSGSHTDETIGWLAIEQGAAADGDTLLQAATTGQDHNDNRSTVTFEESFEAAPSVIAKLGSFAGGDTANLRLDDITATSFGVGIHEEQSFDQELSHTNESVSFIALAGTSGVLTGQGI